MHCGYPSVTAASYSIWFGQCNAYFRATSDRLSDSSRGFAINAGLRQGRVLSPKLYTCVLQWAMANWQRRATIFDFGIVLHDGMPKLVDLQMIFFASSAHEPTVLFDLLIQDLAATGLFFKCTQNCYSHKQNAAPFAVCSFQWASHSNGVW